MDQFLNIIKAHAARLDQATAQPRLGIVASVDPTNFTARVTIQPEGVLSGWLPVSTPWAGPNWGLVCPPSPGDQVVVLWQEGDAENGIVIGRLWSSVATAPTALCGEMWLVHKEGSFIKLLSDGSISTNASAWNHVGDLHVSGNIYDGHGSLATLRTHYNAHAHPPLTTPPIPQD